MLVLKHNDLLYDIDDVDKVDSESCEVTLTNNFENFSFIIKYLIDYEKTFLQKKAAQDWACTVVVKEIERMISTANGTIIDTSRFPCILELLLQSTLSLIAEEGFVKIQ